MQESTLLVQSRSKSIRAADDFSSSLEGATLLDAISMRLQVIGESVKRIQKIAPSFLDGYGEIEWAKIAKFRDLVSHHYESMDHEIVFDICKVHIPKLATALKRMLVEIDR